MLRILYTIHVCSHSQREKFVIRVSTKSVRQKTKKLEEGVGFMQVTNQYFLTYINNIVISCYVPYIVTSIYMWYNLSEKGIFTLVKLRIAVQSPSKRLDKMFSETKKFACISIENIIPIQIDM